MQYCLFLCSGYQMLKCVNKKKRAIDFSFPALYIHFMLVYTPASFHVKGKDNRIACFTWTYLKKPWKYNK